MIFLFALLLIMGTKVYARPVSISNIAPLIDTMGRQVNAHDGCLIEVNGTFYIFGTVYEPCTQGSPICNGRCGYFGNLFAAYSSPDLSNGSWTLLSGNILPAMASDHDRVSYWEANVGYNTRTKQWVMVYWSGHYGFVNNKIALASSTSPAGPFINQAPLVASGASTVISDTVAFWVDPDTQSGYVRYNTRDTPLRHVVEELDDTWNHILPNRSAVIFEKADFPWYDGGGMFKYRNLYFVMLSSDCCFCQWGSDALVFVAPTPLGPWTPQGGTLYRTNEVNVCADGRSPPYSVPNMTVNLCSPHDVGGTNFTIPAQQFSVAQLTSRADGQPLLLYYGEHFNSAPDGIKAHDLQAWIPLEFDASSNALLPMVWKDNFTVNN